MASGVARRIGSSGAATAPRQAVDERCYPVVQDTAELPGPAVAATALRSVRGADVKQHAPDADRREAGSISSSVSVNTFCLLFALGRRHIPCVRSPGAEGPAPGNARASPRRAAQVGHRVSSAGKL